MSICIDIACLYLIITQLLLDAVPKNPQIIKPAVSKPSVATQRLTGGTKSTANTGKIPTALPHRKPQTEKPITLVRSVSGVSRPQHQAQKPVTLVRSGSAAGRLQQQKQQQNVKQHQKFQLHSQQKPLPKDSQQKQQAQQPRQQAQQPEQKQKMEHQQQTKQRQQEGPLTDKLHSGDTERLFRISLNSIK